MAINDISAQYGYGSPYGYGGMYGRGRSYVPQAGPVDNQKPETPPTAEEIVDEQMPSITEAIGLDPFEQAVVRTSLVQSVQQRIELQILELEPLKMKEEIEKIKMRQDAELKAGLPEDKFNAFMELQENQFKAKKKKKKKRKNRD
ncbi:MAG: hypothetical protein VX772_00495 [Bacteroidota bacterium]|nr:hypothetical protein [Bacteroidota bacterium]